MGTASGAEVAQDVQTSVTRDAQASQENGTRVLSVAASTAEEASASAPLHGRDAAREAAEAKVMAARDKGGLYADHERSAPLEGFAPSPYRDSLFAGNFMKMTHRTVIALSQERLVMCYAHPEVGGACRAAFATGEQEAVDPSDASASDSRFLPPVP